MKRRIAITGLGAVTPIGIGKEEMFEASIKGASGFGEVTLFDISGYETKTACEVKNFKPQDFMLPQVFRKIDRFAQFGVASAKLAIEDAGVKNLINESENHIPVVIGTGLGGSLFHEEQIFKLLETREPRKVLSSSVPRIAPNAVSAYIAMEFKLKGPNLAISTACSSGANAIIQAAHYIETGFSDIVVTGGVECPITPFTYAAYQALCVLSKEKSNSPRPFDIKRDGFVLGEGGAILILEELEHARSRGAKIYAELLGYSSNCGAYHMASPMPEGDDAALAMKEAISNSGITPKDIHYINAHGTATKLNDIAESKAIQKIFGPNTPYTSSTKSQMGHTIGAAGAIEAMLTVLTVNNNQIPPNINCDELDPECLINVVRNQALKTEIKYALSNSFGFGSNNAVLVFGKG